MKRKKSWLPFVQRWRSRRRLRSIADLEWELELHLSGWWWALIRESFWDFDGDFVSYTMPAEEKHFRKMIAS